MPSPPRFRARASRHHLHAQAARQPRQGVWRWGPAIAGLAAVAYPTVSAGTDGTPRIEVEIVRELNRARRDPQRYARHLQNRLEYDDSQILLRPGRPTVRTREGRTAVEEAIDFLERQPPVPRLQLRDGLSRGALDHVIDMGRSGATGHTGYDGSQVGDRVNRYGRWTGKVDENIAYGRSDARELIVRLIVDDGVRDRGNRRNLFDADFYMVGVACGSHAEFETMCVITLAADYFD